MTLTTTGSRITQAAPTSRWARRRPTLEAATRPQRKRALPTTTAPTDAEPTTPPAPVIGSMPSWAHCLWAGAGIAAAYAPTVRVLQPGWVGVVAVLPPTLLVALAVGRGRPEPDRRAIWALPLAVSAVGLLAASTGWWLWSGSFASFGGGWRDLLVSTLPARTSPDVLAAIGVTAWVAVTVAVVAKLAGASRAVTALPALVVFGISCALCAPLGGVDPGVVPVVVGVLAVGFVTPAARTGRIRQLGVAVVVVAVAAGAGWLVPLTVHRADLDPRTLLTPAVQQQVAASPLTWVSAWQPGAAVEVFDYRGDLGPAGTLRWVTLDHYNGRCWTTTDRYTLAGSQIRPVDDVAGPLLSGRVSGLRLPGEWLPSPAIPVSVDIGVKVDAASGTLIAADGRPHEYLITAGATRPAAVVGSPAQPSTGLPADIVAAADAAGAGAADDLDRLRAVEVWAAGALRYDPGAPAGQGLPTVTAVLAGRRAGTMDQIVSGFALLARELGYRSRVVVGFDPSGHTVRSTDIVAWPEVFLPGTGWQPFYPVPLAGSGSTLIVRQEMGSGPTVPADVPAADHAEARPAVPSPTREHTTATWTQLLGLALTLAAGLAVAVMLRRRARSDRHFGTPGERTLAAWRSLQRNLVRHGDRGAPALTCEETVDLLTRRLGEATPSGLDGFAADVTGVLFAGRPVDEVGATRGWQVVDEVRRALRRSTRVTP